MPREIPKSTLLDLLFTSLYESSLAFGREERARFSQLDNMTMMMQARVIYECKTRAALSIIFKKIPFTIGHSLFLKFKSDFIKRNSGG